MRIVWSPRAEREITQLRDCISRDSPAYARQFTERMVLAIERLTSMPRSGRTVPEAGHQDLIREIVFQGYRIVYRIRDEQHVEVVTLLHGTRDLASMEPPPW
jgi:toxin ParE1/3/4